MGAKDSKPSCISYEDAVKRVSESEIRRIREAFKKSSGAGGTTLSKNAFLQDVLSEGVPSVLADWLYGACGGQQRGISFKDLFCGLVLLTRGTQDEKIKFLWNVYCNESNTHIVKHEFTKALQIEVTYQPSDAFTMAAGTATNRDIQTLSHTSILISLFGQSDRVTYDQFKSWIILHKKATVLSKWLLLESGVNLSTELDEPTFFQSLAGVTHLEEHDIVDLEKVFWLLKGSAKTGQLDLDSLATLISPPVPWAALAGVFLAFDENCDGHIDFKELCCGVSAACRGPSVERSKFCFKVFDIDRNATLSYDEIKEMVTILIFVAQESNNSSSFVNISADAVLAEMRGHVISRSTDERPVHQQSFVADEPFSFNQEDFMMWSVQNSLNLMQPFMDLLFEVCHIVLGLRPQCRHLEYDIVKGWLSRETSRGYRVGQFWYLISAEWYQNWLHYTQSGASTTPCTACKATTNYNHHQRQISGSGIGNGVDEAVVCDESFTSNSTESMGDLLGTADSSSLGSGSSGISLGRGVNGPPGVIDNTNLIAINGNKTVQTLTGEGGRLKRDLILAQHRDYELVPESLWKALSQWYKGPLPLPRQVIQPPNSPDVELELYPLNLRILRHQNPPPVAQTVSTWGAVAGGYGAITTGGSYTAPTAAPASVLTPPKRYLAYTAAFSRLATVKQVAEFLCQRLKLKLEDIRLWHVYSVGEACLLEDDQLTLQELMIVDNDQFLLEIRNKDLTWPEELGSLSTLTQSTGIGGGTNAGFGNQDRRPTLASIQSVHAPGATGLHNLGNTCFMNSALQVLFNTQPLTQYFKQNMHLYELNTANKLGTKGQLALRYSELLKEVWTASTRSVAPLKLRFCMTKHAPQFAGGGQHDSQELLEWLLDALHEDLNRVTEKPYSELKDSDGRADSVVAAEAWHQHHSRNQSIVIDLFYGQLKSKVSCLACGHDSVRFDPFSLLSLPLPVENFTYCEVLVILLDGSVPIKYGLRLNSDSRYADFKKELSTLCNLHPSLMLVCELYNSQIRYALMDNHRLKMSTATELFCYELPKGDLWRGRTSSELGMTIENGLKDIQRNPALLIMPSAEPPSYQLTTTSTISSITTVSSADDANSVANGPLSPLTARTSTTATSASINTTSTPLSSADSKNGASNAMGAGATERSSKQSVELSTSPESTFVSMSRKSSVNMLRLKESTAGVTMRTNAIDDETGPSNSRNLADIRERQRSEDSSGNESSADNDHHSPNCDCVADHNRSRRHQFHQTNVADDGTCDTIEDIPLCSCSVHCNSRSSAINAAKGRQSGGDTDSSGGGTGGDGGSSSPAIGYRNAGGYLIAVHRKLSRQETYFMSYHKTRPSLFGVPLLIPCHENATNKDLYCAVWLQVARLLSPLPSTPNDQPNHATDCDDSLGYEFPFTLRAVSEGGRICALCPWSKFCRGCEIPCNGDPLLRNSNGSLSSNSSSNTSTPKLSSRESLPNNVNSTSGHHNSSSDSLMFGDCVTRRPTHTSAIQIAIDWDPTALHLRYQSTRERVWTEHESVGMCRKQQTEPVDLDHCLRAFTSEEKLEQSYHCAHCKSKKPATKKLQIWKLPPILIVHLKRFNFVNNKWVKSQKVVNFPFNEFDPTPYLASVPQETILRHKELLDHHATLNGTHIVATASSSPVGGETIGLNDINAVNADAVTPLDHVGDPQHFGSIRENDVAEDAIELDEGLVMGKVIAGKISNEQLRRKSLLGSPTKRIMPLIGRQGRRKRLVSTSLTQTPVIDGDFTDFHQHQLEDGQDPYDLKYQLYAVVSHSGMLNGGHYISYASNPNNAWYCYNDSSCREIPHQPNIDPGSAYLLFYERQGLNYDPYLPKVDDKPIPNGTAGLLDIDETDSDLRKTCSIS